MGLKYPKERTKQKKRHHAESLFRQADGTCYLCVRLHDDYRAHRGLEEHHIFGGPNRKLSEKYGLKVKLCPDHHRNGEEAAHRNADVARVLHEDGQRMFEKHHPGEEFRNVFGKNYL